MMSFNVSNFLTQIVIGVIIVLLTAIAGFLYKLPKFITSTLAFMKTSDERHEEHNRRLIQHSKRLDIHDVLWSTKYRRSINSSMIVDGEMDLGEVLDEDIKK